MDTTVACVDTSGFVVDWQLPDDLTPEVVIDLTAGRQGSKQERVGAIAPEVSKPWVPEMAEAHLR